MFKRFMAYFKPYKVGFYADLFAAFVFSMLSIIYPILTRSMLNDYIPNRLYSKIVYAGVVVFIIYVIRLLLNYFIIYKGHMVGIKLQSDMRRDIFDHLQQLPFSYFDNHETGRIMSRITTDLQDISELAHHGPENIIICTISVIVAFIYLATINLQLAIIIVICVPILLSVGLSFRNIHRKNYRATKAAVATINGNLQNAISGIRVTKAFTNSEKEHEKFLVGNKEYVKAYDGTYDSMAKYNAISTFITDVFNVVVLIAGGLYLYEGSIDFADYSAFIVSVNLFISPIKTLIGFMEQWQAGVAGFERFIEVMDTPIEVDRTSAVDVQKLAGDIEFKNVSYSYDPENPVLKDVSLHITPGQTYALVGPSGGGKTTICHLIPHFYNIEKGDIVIDGKSIDDITLASLRSNIGIVQQDVYLFNATIKDNILYGRLDATDEEVYEAAKKANIHDYIMSLPNGYETNIGERGVRLSGGQKQRLAIARVFLKNPPILILDEATSALDNTTEVLIQKALDTLSKNRTTIVVAHRLSTIKNADMIAVIDDGEIKQLGNHEQLMNEGGMYKDLYNMQFRN